MRKRANIIITTINIPKDAIFWIYICAKRFVVRCVLFSTAMLLKQYFVTCLSIFESYSSGHFYCTVSKARKKCNDLIFPPITIYKYEPNMNETVNSWHFYSSKLTIAIEACWSYLISGIYISSICLLFIYNP